MTWLHRPNPLRLSLSASLFLNLFLFKQSPLLGTNQKTIQVFKESVTKVAVLFISLF